MWNEAHPAHTNGKSSMNWDPRITHWHSVDTCNFLSPISEPRRLGLSSNSSFSTFSKISAYLHFVPIFSVHQHMRCCSAHCSRSSFHPISFLPYTNESIVFRCSTREISGNRLYPDRIHPLNTQTHGRKRTREDLYQYNVNPLQTCIAYRRISPEVYLLKRRQFDIHIQSFSYISRVSSLILLSSDGLLE